jgi:tRNA pseudouridine38-40 synthase
VTTTRLDLEYLGTRFAGWARQPGLRTVQGELEEALGLLLRRPVELTVAGRTDRGVHAWAQVASYNGEPADPVAVNALIGPDVAVRAARSMPVPFDARRDALSRTYCYRVLHRRERSAFERGHALWWPHRLDRDVLHACAAAVTGRHDFTAFTPKETDHVRFERDVAAARWEDRGNILELWIEADSFLRHMNRTLVGTMLEVAGGRRSLEAFRRLLDGRPRAEAGPTAGAHGLHLAAVAYPELPANSPDPSMDSGQREE